MRPSSSRPAAAARAIPPWVAPACSAARTAQPDGRPAGRLAGRPAGRLAGRPAAGSLSKASLSDRHSQAGQQAGRPAAGGRSKARSSVFRPGIVGRRGVLPVPTSSDNSACLCDAPSAITAPDPAIPRSTLPAPARLTVAS
eukprot:119638-Chlamydomonas_euryale.AAC.2